MNLDSVFVADIEAIGLLPVLKSFDDFHVMSIGYKKGGQWNIMSTNDKETIQKFVGNPDNVIVGHNFIGYDKPALEIFGFEFNAQVIDTLPLSYYLYSERFNHGLAGWGETFGVPKPEIENWEDLTYEEYKHRCQEDVKININMWDKCLALLRELYDSEEILIKKAINICNFMMEILKIQENNKILVDLPLAEKNLAILDAIIDEKVIALVEVMPKVPVISKKKRPAKPFKADGSLSATGTKWFDLLAELSLPQDYDDIIEVVSKYKDPNPNSSDQVKKWLIDLGWEPKLFNDGANGKVAQLRDADKNLCSSILGLKTIIPAIDHLEGLSVARHRAGYLKAFLECADEDGYVIAGASKFTKTFRYAHKKPIVNLPGNRSQYGEYIRACLIAPEGFVWANADLSSLEDRCKMISVTPWASPEYLNKPKGYDPHLDICNKAGFMDEIDSDFYKWYDQEEKDRAMDDCPERYAGFSPTERTEAFSDLGVIRHTGKTSNYSCTYGVGPAKLAASADISYKEAKTLIEAFWVINKPVKDYTDSLTTKTADGREWIWNPHTKLWLLLTSDHIKFSAVNQNFGAVVHLRFLFFLVTHGINPIMNVHDELSWYCPKGEEENHKAIVARCMDLTNESFGYDIKFGSKPEFATSYGNVH